MKAPNRHFKLSAVTLTAPVKGLNTRDPMPATAPEYALTLDNMVITPDAVQVRAGWAAVAEAGQNLQTLTDYVHGESKKLFAAGDGKIYDCDPDAGTMTVLQENCLSDQWQTLFYEGYKYFFNGVQTPLVYTPQGTLQAAGFTETDGEGAERDLSGLIGGCVYKNRLFLLEKGSLAFHYTKDAGDKTGELLKFDLAQMSACGGELLIALPWTYATAGGAQESQLVFISNMGEVFIYAGDDPNSIDGFALRGTYKIPRPQSRRAAAAMGSDIALACESGYFMLSNLLSTPAAQRAVAFSDTINSLVSAEKARFGQFGWELTLWSGQNMLLANVPQGTHTVQHVLNTQTGGWSRFKDLDAVCFCVLDGNLYFCRGGQVCKYGAPSDEEIEWKAEFSYTNLGSAMIKAIKKIQLFLQAYRTLRFTVTASVDFAQAQSVYQASPAVSRSHWDTAEWDKSKWGEESNAVLQSIIPCVRPGRYFSFGFQGRTAGQTVKFISMNIFFKTGKHL